MYLHSSKLVDLGAIRQESSTRQEGSGFGEDVASNILLQPLLKEDPLV